MKFSPLCVLLLWGCVKRVPAGERTIVFVARRVHTMDLRRPTAEAIAWRRGKIVAVGGQAEVLAAAGAEAIVETFEDSVIIPGLVDAHAHVAALGQSLSTISLVGAKTEAEAVQRVKAAPKAAYQGDWLMGRGWDQNDWAPEAALPQSSALEGQVARFLEKTGASRQAAAHGYPTRGSLDALYPKTPVFLSRVDGHAAWVNSEALRRAGITAATKDPPGGRILRDAKGEPTGVLIDNAMSAVAAKIPALTDAELQLHLKRALETCARLGLTQVHDAGMDLRTFRQLQQWDMLGVLPLRLYVMADGQGDEAEQYLGLGTFSGRHLEMKAVKLLMDGALGSRGAALHAPYSDEPSQQGQLLLTPERFGERAKSFAERGFQVAVHAIGDRANSVAIEELSKLDEKLRHRVEHAQVLTQADVEKFAKHGLIASFQPTHATSDMPWARARLGPERTRLASAWRSVLATGAHVAFGSDFPGEDPNPLLGLYAVRTRQDSTGAPAGGWMPEQVLSGEEALAGFTKGAAYAAFAEERRGQLKVGFDADFLVLPVDPVADAPKSLLDAKVQVTVVNGVDVYRAPVK